MRSFTLKTAIAAILLTTSLAGAQAAASIEHNYSPPKGEAWEDNPQAGIDTMATTATPARPTTHAAAAQTYRPRLAHIVHGVGTAQRRIHADHNRGLLTRAEYRHFNGRADAIRADAMKTARMHQGALPKANYARLEARLTRLDREIHLAATS